MPVTSVSSESVGCLQCNTCDRCLLLYYRCGRATVLGQLPGNSGHGQLECLFLFPS